MLDGEEEVGSRHLRPTFAAAARGVEAAMTSDGSHDRGRGIDVGDQDTRVSREKALDLAYTRACASYEAITEFRGRLLALLPLATGTGSFLLLKESEDRPQIEPLLGPIGLLGFVVTMGLFAYELRGMQRCSRLEVQAGSLEGKLGLNEEEGPFKGQPKRSLGNMLGPPAAGLIIYLATAFTWIYIAGFGFSWWIDTTHAWWLLLVYAAVLSWAWMLVSRWLANAATDNKTKSGRKHHGGMRADDETRLRDIERENAALKRVVADKELENFALRKIAKGTW